MSKLRTRKPTGVAPFPFILIEGEEKSGKSWAAAEFSASDKVGRTLWIDMGEGSGDEYGAIPGARYEIVEHDGSWVDLLGQIEAAREVAQAALDAGEPPVVLVIDSITAVWDLLKDWAGQRARNSRSGRQKLAADPNAEIDIPMNLWNDANKRWRRFMTMLMTFPGIVVATAKGKEVAALDPNGRPIPGAKEYRVEGQKNLAFDATVWVRMSREHAPMVVAARSVHAGIRPGVDRPKPAPDFSLEWLVFEVLRCTPGQTKPRVLVEPTVDERLTPDEYRREAIDPDTTVDRLLDMFRAVQANGIADELVINENGDKEPLLSLIERIGRSRRQQGVRG